MNQILLNHKSNKKKKFFYTILLFLTLIIILFILLYFLLNIYSRNKSEKFSFFLTNLFNLENLYSDYDNYTTVKLNLNEDFLVIGIIEIPKIEIKYPILSNTNDELLKISPCRFYGPYPNHIGNMCIASHNYDDNRFFSNLYKLNLGDIINIYDSNNLCVSYKVYEKYEISSKDTSCTSQNTEGKREITLVTCNNYNNNRLIIKACE